MKPTTRLRQLLREPGVIMAPAAHDCVSARLIEKAGFPVVYMSGSATSASRLGMPDVGLITLTEMVTNAAAIAGCVNVPVVADADTGYGNPINVQRTIREYERAGVAGLHIEDQESPKRTGHTEGKRLIPREEMVQKILAACDARQDPDLVIIARCDAVLVTGLEDALARGKAYAGAGADMLFIESPLNMEQVTRIAETLKGVPLLYNMATGRRSPLLHVDELARLGYKFVIYAVWPLYAAMRAMQEMLQELKETGTVAAIAQRLPMPEEYRGLMGQYEVEALEARYGIRR